MDRFRKPNRLKHLSYSSKNTYFLTVNILRHEHILGEVLPGGTMEQPFVRLTEIGKIVERAILRSADIPGVTVENYVIMPNHIHLLLDVQSPIDENTEQTVSPNDTVPRTVARIKRHANRDAGKQIFQRSYYDHVIRDQRDYDAHWQYIEDNPAEWLYGAHRVIDGMREIF